ncbi:dephospho-CoA kinase [Peptoniphilus sp.]|uniref:dephospho-CoA kinase n=1 Tax=Peptoniphilus sp. TaxID=1971214 RepID=UPI003D931BB7
MNQNKKIIGLTGSIATGKSLVSKYLSDKGLKVIDADKMARVAAEKKEVIDKIKLAFGDDIYNGKELDRDKLGKIIFKDDSEREKLNSIMFPVIYKLINDEIKRNDGIIFVDIPLLFENEEINSENNLFFDEIWLVYLDRDTQVERLMLRDNIDRDYAKEKISSQISVEEKKKKSDVIIDNSGDIKKTYEQVDEFLGKLK